ncbi:helix-turn-helix domain-containing protein [Flagellimonas myxillae]|uniref:helix-turn-helix domain-containing protein n=1 Tax=Flagellimonas myxillae TaxID=2942214 RepID=UPI00201F8F29|nr:helix-turn-helix domain-containing protein [Muricauda myxillae]MCL6266805.1 helix-turn-helix domain-containing protein [Muricauda myxillae]
MKQEVVLLVLSCLGIAQALFLFVYLITLRKTGDRNNIFLAFVILGLTIRIGKSILNVYFDLDPWQRNLGISGILLTGPFLWFYGKGLLFNMKKLKRMDYLHLLPFVFFVLFCALFPNDGRPISYVIYLLVFGHLAVYVLLSLRVYLKGRQKVHPQRASWFRNLLIGIGLLWLFYMGNLAGLIPFYIGGAVFFSFLIYIFSFLFLQKHAFQLGKYNASTLDKSESGSLVKEVKELLSKEELFLDANVSLESVAKRLNVSARKLSQAINQNEHKNFSDFVNDYRIEKAKQLLSDPKHNNDKIIAIAYDCGFGNVTSFNMAFKAKTQLTPSAYRKQAQAI